MSFVPECQPLLAAAVSLNPPPHPLPLPYAQIADIPLQAPGIVDRARFAGALRYTAADANDSAAPFYRPSHLSENRPSSTATTSITFELSWR